MHSATRRRLALAILVAAAISTVACGPDITTGDASASPPAAAQGSGTLGSIDKQNTAAPAPVEPGPTVISPAYPATATAYAKAVVTAWTQDPLASLASLTTAEVHEQIIEIPQSVNGDWTFLRCDGTAGSSYCTFTNVDGDVFTVQISHQLLAKAHAATGVTLDETEFPADGVAYVKEFVTAWQLGNEARMLLLSTPAVVAQVKKPPVNPTYPAPTCCGGGLLQVKVKWLTSSALFDVGTIKLGAPHAIVGYAAGQLAITS